MSPQLMIHLFDILAGPKQDPISVSLPQAGMIVGTGFFILCYAAGKLLAVINAHDDTTAQNHVAAATKIAQKLGADSWEWRKRSNGK